MSHFSPLMERLIACLRCLPGVGPKSAQRMAFHLLEREREGGQRLSETLAEAIARVGHCQRCRTLSEETTCQLCRNPRRDAELLCIVETPADVMALEQTGSYRGLYFVLMGHLSPLDGIGPDDIGIPVLLRRLEADHFKEIILATNPTVEGEATAHYLGELLRSRGLKTSRIAHGVPLGGELEYIDGGTLAQALAGRLPLETV